MTDDQYIEKLVYKGFSQKQVNQLLKIYLYTKEIEPDLDLSKIDVDIDDKLLRNFAKELKDGNVSNKYLKFLSVGNSKNINITPYLSAIYPEACLYKLLELELEGYNISLLRNPRFNRQQLELLSEALKRNYDILYIANPDYDYRKMSLIIEGFYNNINLTTIMDVSQFDHEQIKEILEAAIYNKRHPQHLIDISRLIHKEYSPEKILLIRDAMENDLDYSLLFDNRSDKNLNAIYQALSNKVETKYLLDEDLTKKQLEAIVDILCDDIKDDFYLSKILDKKYNWPTMRTFASLIKSNKEKYLEYFLDKDYSFEKIHELIQALDNNIDISKLEKIDNIRELHFKRRMLETNNSKYIDDKLSIDEQIQNFVSRNAHDEIIVEQDRTYKAPKYEISCDSFNNQYFITSQNNIVEIGYDEDAIMDLDFFGSVDDNSYIHDFIYDHEAEIHSTIKNFFTLVYDTKEDIISICDIKKNIILEEQVEAYHTDLVLDYTKDESSFYDDLVADTLMYLDEDYTELYCPAFEELKDIAEYGGPNISDEVLIDTIDEYDEHHELIVTKEHIQKEFGDTSIESFKKAKSLMQNYKDYFSDMLNGCSFYFREFKIDGTEIDSCCGFVGDNAIEEIESSTDSFVAELGTFECIEDCLSALEIEEER